MLPAYLLASAPVDTLLRASALERAPHGRQGEGASRVGLRWPRRRDRRIAACWLSKSEHPPTYPRIGNGSSIVPKMHISPGPGWAKSKEGEFHPHYFTYDHFPGARAVATVFKALALLVLVAGVIAAVESGHSLHSVGASNSNVIAVVVGIVGGTIIAASAMAFFGYVLQLLVAIHFDVRYVESAKLAEDL